MVAEEVAKLGGKSAADEPLELPLAKTPSGFPTGTLLLESTKSNGESGESISTNHSTSDDSKTVCFQEASKSPDEPQDPLTDPSTISESEKTPLNSASRSASRGTSLAQAFLQNRRARTALVPDGWSVPQGLPYLDVNVDGVYNKNSDDPTGPLSPEQLDRIDSDIVAAEARACGLFCDAELGSIFMPHYHFVKHDIVRIYFSKTFSFGEKELGFLPESWDVKRCSQWVRVQFEGVQSHVSKTIYLFLPLQFFIRLGSPVTAQNVSYAVKKENGLKLAHCSVIAVPTPCGPKGVTDEFTMWVNPSLTRSLSCGVSEWLFVGESDQI